MAFGSTITLTINTVAKVLNRINQDNYGSEYYLREATQEFRIRIRHSKEKLLQDGRYFDRHNVEVTQTIYATSTTPEIVKQDYVVLRNLYNEPVADAGYLADAFFAYLRSGTVQTDLFTWQS